MLVGGRVSLLGKDTSLKKAGRRRGSYLKGGAETLPPSFPSFLSPFLPLAFVLGARAYGGEGCPTGSAVLALLLVNTLLLLGELL